MKINYEPYLAVVRSQLSRRPSDWDFKRQPLYQGILEHVSEEQGHEYLRQCQLHFPEHWRKHLSRFVQLCIANDRYGQPIKASNPNFPPCSPTCLRYLYYSLAILKQTADPELNIIEIGGGYGGLCLFIHRLAPLFGKTIKNYTIFDLPEVAQLQNRYLEAHGITATCTHLNSGAVLTPNSFLISMYALSELPAPLRKQYRESVVMPFCTEGFIIWNINPYDDELDIHYSTTRRPEAVNTADTNFELTLKRKTLHN